MTGRTVAGLSQWVKQLAVRQLPPGIAERMTEEWQAHLDATPSVAQTMVAAGFLIAAVQCKLAVKFARSDWSAPIAIRVLAAVLLLYVSPIFLIVPLSIKLGRLGPVFVWSSHPGQAAYFPTFRCPRGTLGWILRKTRCHTSPLLYSVLRGDLTLTLRGDPTFKLLVDLKIRVD